MTEPRDLTGLVPADVRVELAAVVAALELHGPAVTNALQRLDRATTAAWNAVNPLDPTEDEWWLVERAVGIEHGWNAPTSWSPPSNRLGRAAHQRNPGGSQAFLLVQRIGLHRAIAQTPRPLAPRFAAGCLVARTYRRLRARDPGRPGY